MRSLLIVCLLVNLGPAWSASDASAVSANPGTSSGLTPAPDPANATTAASTLNALAKTVKANPAASALVAALQKVEQNKAPPAPKGLIGLISDSLDVIQSNMLQVAKPQKYWQEQFARAADELSTILSRQEGETPLTVLLHFIEMMALFGFVAITFRYVGKRVRQHFKMEQALSIDPSVKEVLIYILRHIVPLVLALLVEIAVVITLPPSLGRALATLLLYTMIGASVFRAFCAIIFSLSSSGHRNVAIHIMYRRAWKLLYLIGFAGWFGDAINNPKLYFIIGGALSSLGATAANLLAAILCGVFALRFRRPVAHLIRNRSLEVRGSHRARMETLEIVASLWHYPILLLAGGVSLSTVFGPASSGEALNHALSSVALLVSMFFIGTLLHRIGRGKKPTSLRRQSPYILRLKAAIFSLLQIVMWIGFLELLTRVWDHSLLNFANTTQVGHLILAAIGKIALTLTVAWLAWIVLDTAIQEAITPSRSGRYGRNPTTRMRTILPLLRNAALLIILTATVITTLANLGLNVTPLLASAGVVGLAIGFGSQSLVKDVITGIFILIEDSMSVGDWVDVGNGHIGTVEHMSIRTVRLRDGNGSVHSVPFSQILAVKNDSREYAYAALKLHVTLESSIEDALKLMRETGAEMIEDARLSRLLLAPIDIYGLNGFDLHGAILTGAFRTRPQTQAEVVRAFNLRIKAKVDAAPNITFANEWANFPAPAVPHEDIDSAEQSTG
ncbi:mechanosensitive ion channel family protein [Glaciimonas immobilis]|uniref:Small conductance mechanosensitive channel n=1 Tax=Glaciimonas immobilis TaxID=728004 RepID=A0A840RTS1_9BURK|nr:mechanosensitive ion channel domain-containing protein [Glaciimonas immobilis]KAF3997723.1 mechanosensitive ion channel [Glaciimonas immobilis]MBB5200552.1 small conductance mechanosensitive channel [Glaciimonas immobilis]